MAGHTLLLLLSYYYRYYTAETWSKDDLAVMD